MSNEAPAEYAISVEQALQIGIDNHTQGRFAEAEGIYRKILQINPDHVDALHLLGLIAFHAGQNQAASSLIEKAAQLAPLNHQFHSNLSAVYFAMNRMEDALMRSKIAISIAPTHPDAYVKQGNVHRYQEHLEEAISSYQQALKLSPNMIEAMNNLGVTLMHQKNYTQALPYLKQVLALQPDAADTQENLWMTLRAIGNFESQIEIIQNSLSTEPKSAELHFELGQALQADCQFYLAIASYLESLMLNKVSASPSPSLENRTLLNLARCKIEQGLPDDSFPYIDKAFQLNPGSRTAQHLKNIALHWLNANESDKEKFFNAGLIEKAEELAKIDLANDHSVENHNFLLKCYLASHLHDAQDLFDESRAWSVTHDHEADLPDPAEFTNTHDPDRRLKVGIVGDYFAGVIGKFTLFPYFERHDQEKIELYCYNFGGNEAELIPIVDQYRNIRGYSGQDFFDLVRKDQIDILLDINGRIRTPNYFETLLNQPAPIQVNWYNLPCTVGVKAFNYAITDEYCVHPNEENLFVENVFRMPTGTIIAWDMGEPPVASPAPFQKNKHITFGCFGDFFKINEEVLATWAEILKQVPDSKLYLKGQYLRLEEHRARIEHYFSNQGISPSRLMLEGMSTFEIMKKCYGQMDIALDTFPYSSGSTTINALWQGVPVIAINGSAWRERSTAAVLAGCGLDEFIANDQADYIRKAIEYARQPSPLLSLRENLGMLLLKSPQWQTETFARNFETVLRQIWHHWLSQFHTN